MQVCRHLKTGETLLTKPADMEPMFVQPMRSGIDGVFEAISRDSMCDDNPGESLHEIADDSTTLRKRVR